MKIVACIYGYGGWFSSNSHCGGECMWDSLLVDMVESGVDPQEIQSYMDAVFPEGDWYDADALSVVEVPDDTCYTIAGSRENGETVLIDGVNASFFKDKSGC